MVYPTRFVFLSVASFCALSLAGCTDGPPEWAGRVAEDRSQAGDPPPGEGSDSAADTGPIHEQETRPLRQGWVPEGVDRPLGVGFVVVDTAIFMSLDTIRGHTEDGKAIFVNVDSLTISKPPPEYGLVFACGVNDGPVTGEIFAVAHYVEQQYLTEVLHAWRIDLERLRFVSIPTEGLRCYNESYGVD